MCHTQYDAEALVFLVTHQEYSDTGCKYWGGEKISTMLQKQTVIRFLLPKVLLDLVGMLGRELNL